MKMRVKDVANKYGVTRSTVYNWIKKGLDFDVDICGGLRQRYVLDSEKVEKFLSEQKESLKGRVE